MHHSRVSKEVSKDWLRSRGFEGGASKGCFKGWIRRRVSKWVSEEAFGVDFEGRLRREASKEFYRRSSKVTSRADPREASKGGFGSSKEVFDEWHPKGGVQGADSAETWHYGHGPPIHRFLNGAKIMEQSRALA